MRSGSLLLGITMLLGGVLSFENNSSGFGDIESVTTEETSNEEEPGSFHSSKTIYTFLY